MNNEGNINKLNSVSSIKKIPKSYKGCLRGCLVGVVVTISIIIIGIVYLNLLFPSSASKGDIQNTIIKNKGLFEDAVVCINEIKQKNAYIDEIQHTKFYPADKNPSIKGLFTGGIFKGQYIQTSLKNKTLEKLFLNKGVKHITIFDKYIEFAFEGGAGQNYYCGAVYTNDGNPVGFDGSKMQLVADGKGWSCNEANGDKKYYTEKIIDNWYFYEMLY